MNNYMKELHPWSVVIYLFMIMFLIMVLPYDKSMILMFLLLSVNVICSLGIRKYMSSFRFFVGMILFFAVFNVIFNPRGETAVLYINDRPLTKESFYYGMYMGFMVSSMFLWFKIFQDTLDNRKITYLIGSRFPVTGLIVSMVFCYYEKFINKIDKIKEVWNTYVFEEAKHPVKKAGIVLSVLLSVMLEDSMDTAMSMNARGYGKGKRSGYISYDFQWMDGVLIAIVALLPVLWFLQPSKRLFVVVYYLLLPVFYQIFKELQWKYYLSKI